jgi:uncharacterized OsmC-like protein
VKSTAKLVEGCFQSIVDDGRRHGIVLDLPEAKEGDDLGPTALELAVMALAGCVTTIWAIVAKNSNVSYHKITVELDADKPDSEPTITSVKAVVKVESDDDEDKLQRCLDKTLKACPVGQLYEKAGVAVETKLEVVS